MLLSTTNMKIKVDILSCVSTFKVLLPIWEEKFKKNVIHDYLNCLGC
jgi:hypothetical protein